MKDGLLRKLMSSIKCSSCNNHFEESGVEVLGNSKEMWFLQAICSSCHTQSLVVAIVQKCSGSNVVSDLTDTEQVKFATVNAVSADDLLNMHGFLEGFNGDFSHLFRQVST